MPIDAPTWNSRAGDLERARRARRRCARRPTARARAASAGVAGEVAEQEQELVAALAREHVAGRACGPETRCAAAAAPRRRRAWPSESLTSLKLSRSKYRSATRVAGAPRAGEVAAELLLQLRPVRQAGEAVVVGEEGDLRLGALALGDVLAGAQRRR